MNVHAMVPGMVRWLGRVALFTMFSATVQAQSSQDQALIGTWVVTVAGEDATRTLSISEEAPTAAGALLRARYGMTGKKLALIDASMTWLGSRRQLNLVTPASTVIAATEQADGTFYGTFALKSGVVKGVLIVHSQELETMTPAKVGSPVPARSVLVENGSR